MEASALQAPAVGRLALTPAFLRLRSDDQLVALFRAGNEEAFGVIVERYRQRLFAYVRQMMGAGSRQDAEDVMQDVFVRAYGALRADDRPVMLRAWLYRVAHNRCIDVLRRPVPPAAEVFEMSRKPLHDPIEEAQRREDLKRLVRDVGRLPDQQRSALLMREIDGLPYNEIADALAVTVPAVKSLLVRARMGLVEAQEARELDCSIVREDLASAYERGVKASGRARRHMRECSGCREYRTALRGMRRSFAALTPVGFAPLAFAAKALGVGGAGGGAAAGGSAGGAAAVAGGGTMATATVCKVAAVVCATAVTAGGAVEVKHLVRPEASKAKAATVASAPTPVDVSTAAGRQAALTSAAATAPAPIAEKVRSQPAPVAPAEEAPITDTRALPTDETMFPAATADQDPAVTGGTAAPSEEELAANAETAAPAGTRSQDGSPAASGGDSAPVAEESATGGQPPANGGSSSEDPPPEH